MPGIKNLKGIFFLILVFSSINSYCQEFEIPPKRGKNKSPFFPSHFIFSAGLNVHAETSNGIHGGLTADFRLNIFHIFPDLSAGFSFPIVAGFSPETSTPFFSTPVLLQINLGNQATKDFFSGIGLSLGGGFTNLYLSSGFEPATIWSGRLCWSMLGRPWALHYGWVAPYSIGINYFHSFSLTTCIGKWVKKTGRLNKLDKFMRPYRR